MRDGGKLLGAAGAEAIVPSACVVWIWARIAGCGSDNSSGDPS
jgi:hypothetical protein